ncbi:hypothetical protein B566_EDAN016780 [Ephemera danica]|nr:hypothetical protein B566_EDAN016780 [Ephemera danica]
MENSSLTHDSFADKNRGLFDLFDLGVGSLRAKCSAVVNRPSTVLPNLGVVLTRLANNRVYFFSQTASRY